MTDSVVVLCVLAFAGVPTTCSQCTDSTDYTATLQPEDIVTASEGDLITLMCSTNLPALFPRWRINDNEYKVSLLPPGFTADGLNLEFTFRTRVNISCFFRVISDGSVVDICSPDTIVVPRDIRDEEDISQCHSQNITFLNLMRLSEVHITDNRNLGENCKLLVEFSECAAPDNVVEREVQAKDRDLTIDVVIPEEKFSSNVSVETSNNCNVCGRSKYYIPDMRLTEYKSFPRGYTGTIIDDLSSDYYNFNDGLIDYKICTYSGGLTECFDNPCNNGKFQPSNCNGNSEKISLEAVGEIENGTEVSIFSTGFDCRRQVSDVLLFNFVISVPPSPSPSSSPVPTSEAGLSPGAIAGIVVAAVVAALLIGLIVGFIIFWIYRYQKWPVNTKTERLRSSPASSPPLGSNDADIKHS